MIHRTQKLIAVIVLAITACHAYSSEKSSSGSAIKIMTFNLWKDGNGGQQPLSQTAKVIQIAKADIVGLQEVNENAKALADQLGWQYVQQTHDTAVLTRFRILETTNSKLGVKILCDSGEVLYVFNVHFSHAPYQPYQLLDIPYANAPFLKTETEAIAAAKKARGQEVSALIEEINGLCDKTIPVIVTGDFNEPSHLDWTQAAANTGRHPLMVQFPTTSSLEQAGLIDTYRAVYPNEIQKPGFTWTPLTDADDRADHHDRIDFIFCNSSGVKIRTSMIVGEGDKHADIVVSPYPSDHRAVVTTFAIPLDDENQDVHPNNRDAGTEISLRNSGSTERSDANR